MKNIISKGLSVHRIQKDSLFLIDGSSLLYRSYYGIRPLHNSKGVPSQAIYGFCRSIKKLIDDFDPAHLLLVWDTKGKTIRSEMYPEYKATRQAPPSDLFVQKEYILKIADLVGIHQLAKAGFEADDLIYSIVQDHKDRHIVLVGPDKDLHQLISPKVLILDPMKKEIIGEEEFFKKHGFKPDKLAFYHALVGDASDNIPGVAGIGDKSATQLVQQFDSLEDLYKNLDAVKSDRMRKQLSEHKDDAFLSLKLFLFHHVPTATTIRQMQYDKSNWYKANDLFLELEFNSLAVEPPRAVKQHGPEMQTNFLQPHVTSHETKKNWKLNLVQTKQDLFILIEHLKKEKLFAFDTETTGSDAMRDELVGISIAYDDKQSYYIPLAHTNNHVDQLDKEWALEHLKPIFTNSAIKKILHHAKFDELVLLKMGIETHGLEYDTLLAANLLRKESEKIGLKILSLSYLKEKMTTFKEILGKKYKTFAQVPLEEAAEYAAHDALQTFKLAPVLQKEMKKHKELLHIFNEMEMPLEKVLLAMEYKGVLVDPDALNELKHVVDKQLKTIEHKITAALEHQHHTTAASINLNSPKQIETLLFDELKLTPTKKSSTGQRSTDQEVLEELSKVHPVPGLILQHRELYKLKSTYIEALPLAINPTTKRIHTSFSQTMVATGRLSSSDPNLQNIPAGHGLGLEIRAAFIAPHGKRLLSADYSQIELRVLAHMTKDKNLTDAFLHDKDIHTQTAAQLFDVPLEQVTTEQRQTGKRINFSIIYGLTPYGLSRDLGIKPSEAKEYIEKYFNQYPGVAAWMEKTVEQATSDGYTTTLWGRRRYVPGLHEKNKTLYEAARRIAINSPVQGTSAEIMKLAMINTSNSLKKDGFESDIVLQIHDELILECPHDEVENVEKLLKKEMERVVAWEVPLRVATRIGKNWAEITK